MITVYCIGYNFVGSVNHHTVASAVMIILRLDPQENQLLLKLMP
jgi:hypothetical protein